MIKRRNIFLQENPRSPPTTHPENRWLNRALPHIPNYFVQTLFFCDNVIFICVMDKASRCRISWKLQSSDMSCVFDACWQRSRTTVRSCWCASMFSHTVSTVMEILPSHVSLQGLGHECQQRLGQPTPSNKRCLQLNTQNFLKKKKSLF